MMPYIRAAWHRYTTDPLKGLLAQRLVPALRQRVEESLPRAWMPSTFLVLESLPLTVGGKVDRRALPAPTPARPDWSGPYVAPRNDLEAQVAGIWEELLFRGFLIWFLAPYAGVVGAVAISTLAFGLGHAYQGWRGIPRTGVIGLILAAAYVAGGSLWWVMAAHALLDLYGGLLAWRISRMPEAAPPA